MNMAEKMNDMEDKNWRSNPAVIDASGDTQNKTKQINKQIKTRTIGAYKMTKDKDIFLNLKNKNK